MLKILKIQSRWQNSNPLVFQQSTKVFHQSKQKHNMKPMKTLTTLLYLILVCENFQNQKFKCQIKIFKLY
jgi:hypothetical protein